MIALFLTTPLEEKSSALSFSTFNFLLLCNRHSSVIFASGVAIFGRLRVVLTVEPNDHENENGFRFVYVNVELFVLRRRLWNKVLDNPNLSRVETRFAVETHRLYILYIYFTD